MSEELKSYRVEVNVNFVFYVDVDAASEDDARKYGCDRAYEKAEEIVGSGNDEEDMLYGIARPDVGDIELIEEE